jgi:hypothetical protein
MWEWGRKRGRKRGRELLSGCAVSELTAAVRTSLGSENLEDPVSSDCSTVTWLLGIAAILLSWDIARRLILSDVDTTLLVLIMPAFVMAAYELAVLKVYKRSSTGLDFSSARPKEQNVWRTFCKTIGHWVCWGGIAVYCWCFKEVQNLDHSDIVFGVILKILPVLLIASPIYIFVIDSCQVKPDDGSCELGRWILRRPAATFTDGAKQFVLAYCLRALFLPWVLVIAHPPHAA